MPQRHLNLKLLVWASELPVAPADLSLCGLGLGLQYPSGLKKTVTRLCLDETYSGLLLDPSFGVSPDSDASGALVN